MISRALILSLAMRNKLPTVYPQRYFAREGGLIAYGPDNADSFTRAAAYVDRLLRGAQVGELPVQVPTKFELSVNVITAREMGLTIPPTLLARADEVIE